MDFLKALKCSDFPLGEGKVKAKLTNFTSFGFSQTQGKSEHRTF